MIILLTVFLCPSLRGDTKITPKINLTPKEELHLARKKKKADEENLRLADERPYSRISYPLIQDNCAKNFPEQGTPTATEWQLVMEAFLESDGYLFGPPGTNVSALYALEKQLHSLYRLMYMRPKDEMPSYACPILAAKLFKQCAQLASSLRHHRRARVLLQLGNMFKLQALSRWWVKIAEQKDERKKKGLPTDQKNERFHSQLQASYQISLTSSQQLIGQRPKNLGHSQRAPDAGFPQPRKLIIEIHSICSYTEDQSSNTDTISPLPDLVGENHKLYAGFHNYTYVQHEHLPLPHAEPHYSKMILANQRLKKGVTGEKPLDWLFFIDCDAFFTNFTNRIEDILTEYNVNHFYREEDEEGYRGSGRNTHFLVAEDSAGINTGILLFRAIEWTTQFLIRAAINPYGIAWDQSMFLTEIIAPGAFYIEDSSTDYEFPEEVQFVHQANMNAFVQPAARDWLAYEWQVGDFIKHFAGCPWQEKPCLRMMQQTMDYVTRTLK